MKATIVFLLSLLVLGCNRNTKPAAGTQAEQPRAQQSSPAQPQQASSAPAQRQPTAGQPEPGAVTAVASTSPTFTAASPQQGGAVAAANASLSPTQTSPAQPVTPSSATPSSEQSSSAQISKHETDKPLVVAGQTYHFVVRTLRVEHPGPRRPDDDETVESWELRDPSGKVAYQESLGTPAVHRDSFDNTESVDASAFNTKQGSGVIVEEFGLPSAPDSGGSTLVLGLHEGKLIPFGPPIYANEYLGLDVDPQRVAQEAKSGGRLMLMHDVMKFRLWTGNFNIVYPVLINWLTGSLEPAWRCISGAGPQRVERCPYDVKVDPVKITQQTFVRLYPEAEDNGRPQHLVVNPGSKIEFLQAEAQVKWSGDAKALTLEPNNDDIWLKIRVDGKEGWIHSQEDFAAVGLPEAG